MNLCDVSPHTVPVCCGCSSTITEGYVVENLRTGRCVMCAGATEAQMQNLRDNKDKVDRFERPDQYDIPAQFRYTDLDPKYYDLKDEGAQEGREDRAALLRAIHPEEQ